MTRQAEDSDRKDKDTSDENTAFLKKPLKMVFFQLQGRCSLNRYATIFFLNSRGSNKAENLPLLHNIQWRAIQTALLPFYDIK